MRIRAVKPEDPAIAALLQYLQLSALPYDIPIAASHTTTDYWWVAFDDVHPVAFAALTLSAQWGDTGYLSRAGVLPAYRGQGLQKKLIKVRERKAKQLGWQWLVTDTTDNPPSANNLIDCGFKTFIPSRPWGFDSTIYWKKKLTK